MIDVEEATLELYPNVTDAPQGIELDSAVFGLVSSSPLGHGSCSQGVARPGYPFLVAEKMPKQEDLKGTWSTHSVQLRHRGFEMNIVQTSNYWQTFVDRDSLQHDSIAGVRRLDGGALDWNDLKRLVLNLQSFIGWINHCVSPVAHVKGYRKGKLVYRRYDLYPHPTIQRDGFSWLPRSDFDGRAPVQELFDRFVDAWENQERNNGTLHIVLQKLGSRQKGSPSQKPSIEYFRDTFLAHSMLEAILSGRGGLGGGRDGRTKKCLKATGVKDVLPVLDADSLDVVKEQASLWEVGKQERRINEEERDRETLSRPLANIATWMAHFDDPEMAEKMMAIPNSVQQYLLEVSIWLADLMLLKVVGFNGRYFNRLTREVELVPWCEEGTVVAGRRR